jgi:hypothetical protein
MGRSEDVPVANQSPATADVFVIEFDVNLLINLHFFKETKVN